VLHPLVDAVIMTLGSGDIFGEDVLMDLLENGRSIPRRKTTVNVISECELLVLSLVDSLQVLLQLVLVCFAAVAQRSCHVHCKMMRDLHPK
jgi:CRP-like cAMP-binding protein